MRKINKELVISAALLHLTDFLSFEASQKAFSSISNAMFSCLSLKNMGC